MYCAHQKPMVGQAVAADRKYGSQVRHQSLYVFIISKLQFTIYIIKKNQQNNIYNNDVDDS